MSSSHTDVEKLGSSTSLTSPNQDAASDQHEESLVYPEGGRDAYMSMASAWLFLFCAFGYTNSFGVFQSYYALERYTTESDSAIAWIGSVQTFLQFIVSAFAGYYFDKGYFWHLAGVGSALFVFCFFMTSLTHTFWQAFLAQGVGIGISIGLLFLPALGIVTQYFMKRRGIATGVVVTGSSAGGICLPIMLNKLFDSLGFERGMQYTGCLMAGLLVIALVLARPGGGVRRPKDQAKIDIKSFFKEPAYLSVILGTWFTAWGLFFPIFFIQVFAERSGASPDLVFYTLAMLNAGSIVGRIIPNFLADIFGSLNLFAIMSFASSATAFALYGAEKSTAALIAVTVLYGMTSGAFVSLLGPALFSFAKTQAEVGKRGGFAFLALSFAALTGSPIGGALVDRYGFNVAIAFCGSMLGAGGACIGVAALLKGSEKGTRRV